MQDTLQWTVCGFFEDTDQTFCDHASGATWRDAVAETLRQNPNTTPIIVAVLPGWNDDYSHDYLMTMGGAS